jgi:predicted AAA+ superfamily ATPase
MYSRTLSEVIKKKMGRGKAILLIGPRQVGKTTLLKSIISDQKHLFLDCDDPTVRSILNNPNTEQIRSIIGSQKLIFIDEAQRIPGIGLTLKLIIDQFKDVQLLLVVLLHLIYLMNLMSHLPDANGNTSCFQLVGRNSNKLMDI